MKQKWHILQPDAELTQKLSTHLRCHPITAAVLVNRNLTSAKAALNFLAPIPPRVPSPFGLKENDGAVKPN